MIAFADADAATLRATRLPATVAITLPCYAVDLISFSPLFHAMFHFLR